MHSQTTEFTMDAMDFDPNAKMLLSLCAHPRDPGFCIALHSLAGESFFNFKVCSNLDFLLGNLNIEDMKSSHNFRIVTMDHMYAWMWDELNDCPRSEVIFPLL